MMENNKWKPLIKRKDRNCFPNHILQFFHAILVEVENDKKSKTYSDWRNLSILKSRLTIISDTKKNKFQIPSQIEFGSIYFKEENSKSKNFLKNIRHAFAHNYILIEENDVIKIALPAKNKKSIKLACYLSFSDFQNVVSIIKKN